MDMNDKRAEGAGAEHVKAARMNSAPFVFLCGDQNYFVIIRNHIIGTLALLPRPS